MRRKTKIVLRSVVYVLIVHLVRSDCCRIAIMCFAWHVLENGDRTVVETTLRLTQNDRVRFVGKSHFLSYPHQDHSRVNLERVQLRVSNSCVVLVHAAAHCTRLEDSLSVLQVDVALAAEGVAAFDKRR